MNDLERMVLKFRNFGTIRTQEDVTRLQDTIVELFDIATSYRIVAADMEWTGTGDERCRTELQGHVDHAAHRVFLELQDERRTENFS
jgi:hypothetical protein